jgi:hypothetical protein
LINGAKMPFKNCPNCGEKIGNHSKYHYYCGWGRPTLRPDGYLKTYCPDHPMALANGDLLLHRAVWFDVNGEIPEGFEIHHKNEDKTDNRIENLELKTKSNHAKEHIKRNGKVKNQYGEFSVIHDPELRRLRDNELNKAGREKRKMELKSLILK